MKTLIILLLGSASVLGAESDIRVFSSAHTNAAQAMINTKDVFMREGQTNLVRTTKTVAGNVSRVCRFYHAGQCVGNFLSFSQGKECFNTEATSYCMSLKFGPLGEIQAAQIGDKDGVLLDEFSYTNGVFFPVEKATVDRANAKGEHMKPKFGSDFIETHKRG